MPKYCNQTCTYTAAAGTVCSCGSGYYLSSDNRSCNAINYCSVNNGGCQQICQNIGPGSISCLCTSGYQLSANGQNCDAASASSGGSNLPVIIGIIAGGILLVAVLVVAVIRRRRKQTAAAGLKAINFDSFLASALIYMRADDRPVAPVEVLRKAIKLQDVIAKGDAGSVCRAVIKDRATKSTKTIAVKTLPDGVSKHDYLMEATILAQLSHRSVTAMLGVVTRGYPLLMLKEYCENGTLEAYLQKYQLLLPVQIKMASECAEGMAYLASKGYVHTKLCSRHVLLDDKLVPKLSGFPSDRESHDKTYYVTQGGERIIRWTAVEVIQSALVSEQSDIWSFGVLLFEIFSRAVLPYAGLDNQQVWDYVTSGKRLQSPLNCPADVYSVMTSCWLPGTKRPTFAELVTTLAKMAMVSQATDSNQPEYSVLGEIYYSTPNTLQPLATKTGDFGANYVEPNANPLGSKPRRQTKEPALFYEAPDQDVYENNAEADYIETKEKVELVYMLPDVDDANQNNYAEGLPSRFFDPNMSSDVGDHTQSTMLVNTNFGFGAGKDTTLTGRNRDFARMLSSDVAGQDILA